MSGTEAQAGSTVVIVTYNSTGCIRACLDSLLREPGAERRQIIVVDNASRDGTTELVAREYPDVELIALDDNRGYAAANNAARPAARGSRVCFLNPDVELLEGTLLALEEYLASEPGVAAVGPRLVLEDGRLDRACKRSFPTPWNAFCRFARLDALFPSSLRFSSYNLLYLPDDAVAPVECLVGAFLLVRREKLDEVEWFSEDYFLYGEDIDLCYQLVAAGGTLAYYGRSTAIHAKGASFEFNSRATADAFFDSMLIFMRRHHRSRFPRPLTLVAEAGVRGLWAIKRLELLVRPRRRVVG